MWILIVILYSQVSFQEFGSQEACREASVAVASWVDASTLCMPKEG